MIKKLKEIVYGRKATGDTISGPCGIQRTTKPDWRMPYNIWCERYSVTRSWNPSVNTNQRMW